MRSSKIEEMEEWDMAYSSLFVNIGGLGGMLVRYLLSSQMNYVLKVVLGVVY
jgi:hypothetical protein